MSKPKWRDEKFINYDPADPNKMRLPRAMTCGQCVHIVRCKGIFGHVESDTYCDWSPSRFYKTRKEGTDNA